MVKKSAPAKSAPAQADPAARLQEAQARLKAAEDRQAAIVSVLSRLSTSAQDKRMAQIENRKVEIELREARRLVQEARDLAPKP